MALLDTIKTIFSGGNIIDSVSNAVDKFITTDAEKEQLKKELLVIQQDYDLKKTEQLNQIEQAYLADTANAREMNVKVQESNSASWLSKNIAYFFDMFILLIWGFMTIYIAMRWLGFIESTNGNPDMTGILGIYSGLTALATMIIQFHRGSSDGSQKKTNIMTRNNSNN